MNREDKFSYAHNETAGCERTSRTAALNRFELSPEVRAIREDAFGRGIPVSGGETLAFLCICVEMSAPKRILEIGAAVGVSGICMLEHSSATLTTVEINAAFADEARRNIERAGLSERAEVICADAAEVLPALEGGFDFIFLDGPKVQYVKYLPELIRLLNSGGVIFADDVLLYGWVNGECEAPRKRHMLVEHIREYIDAAQSNPELCTTIVDVGDGVALSVKVK